MKNLDLLKKMIEIDSSNFEGQNKMIDLLKNELSSSSSKIKIIGKTHKNILAYFGNLKSQNILLINCHVDAVSAKKEDFSFNPFCLTKQDEFLYGRGIGDMKGGIFASLNAIIKAKNENLLKDKLIIFAGSCDEETGSDSPYGSASVVDYFLKENISINGCIIPEPNKFERPVKINLGHRGLVWVKAISTGIKMHSGTTLKENNAITKLIEFLNALNKKLTNQPKKDKRGVPESSARVTFIKSPENEFNVIPSCCECFLDIRISPYDKNKNVIKMVQKLAVKHGVKIEVIKNTPSSSIKRKEKIVSCAINACENLGFLYEVGYASPTCDAHFYNNAKIPTLICFGVDAKNVHANDECITQDSLKKCEDLIFEFIKLF